MKKTIFMEKYPIFSYEINKNETSYKNVNEIIQYLKELIESHPVAVYISVFDHYEHTSSMEDGVIAEDIKDAKNLIFCFGKQLPSSKILAVRPRSIGVCESEDSFIVDFLEVPNEQLHETTIKWIKSIANK
jgi:hypothetical protein